MTKKNESEIAFIADRLIQKVWQGDETRRGLALSAASVALAAIQDFTAGLYMESTDR